MDDRPDLPPDWQAQIFRAYGVFSVVEFGPRTVYPGEINNPEFEEKINRVQKGLFGRKQRARLDLKKGEGFPEVLPEGVTPVADLDIPAAPEGPEVPKIQRHVVSDVQVKAAADVLSSKINGQPRPPNIYTTPEAMELLVHDWLNQSNIDSETVAQLRGLGLEEELLRLSGYASETDVGADGLRPTYGATAKMVSARLVSDALQDVPFEDLNDAIYGAWHAQFPGTTYWAYKQANPKLALAKVGPGTNLASRDFWNSQDPEWHDSKPKRMKHDAEPGKKYSHLALDTTTGRLIALDSTEEMQDSYADGKVLVVKAGTPEAETMLRDDLAREILAWWATSSNDATPSSLAQQEIMAEREPDIEHAPWKMLPVTRVKVNSFKKKHGDLINQSLDAQETQTQDFLGALGITNMRLFRGVAINSDNVAEIVLPESDISAEDLEVLMEAAKPGEAVSLQADMPLQRPLSSWSRQAATAQLFTFTHEKKQDVAVMSVSTVDGKDIISTTLTGNGAYDEQELVTKRGGTDTTLILRRGKDIGAFKDPRLRNMAHEEGQFIAVNVDVGDVNADWIKAVEREAREAQAAAAASAAAFSVPDNPEEAAQMLAAITRHLQDAAGPMAQELARQRQELQAYLRAQEKK